MLKENVFYAEFSYMDGRPIPATEQQLKQLFQRFEDFQRQRIKQGYRKPEQMPSEMLKEKFRLEAV